MANVGTALPLYIAIQAFLGQPDFTHQTVAEFIAQSTQTGSVVNSLTVNIPAGGSVVAALATLMSAISNTQFVIVQDVTSVPQAFNFGFSAPASVPIAPAAPMCWVQNGGVPPTIYLSNVNAGASTIQVTVVSL